MAEEDFPKIPILKAEKKLEANAPNIDILLNEYNQCNTRIENFLNRQDTILQIASAIIGGSMIYGLLNPIPEELFILIPFIPLIFVGHIGYHYSRVIANQGYKKYLTKVLNRYLDSDEKIQYSYLAKKHLLNDNSFSN